MVFSENEMLLNMWSSYKKKFIEESTGRTVDPSQDNISTSESESYAMLRSVWMDDRETFDRSWGWAQKNLQRPDKLFSWRYGPLEDGSYGIQASIGGQNSASDGDNDIALALLMAYSRWNDSKYLEQAKSIIDAIWKYQVVSAAGKPVLASNDLERRNTDSIVVNPSYFSPAAWRIFATVDPSHDWKDLVDNSYTILDQMMTNTLDSSASSGLPPDWVLMKVETGELLPATDGKTSKYSYDAIRTPWRIGLDWQWHEDERSKKILERMSHLSDEWNERDRLVASYNRDGSVSEDYESPAMYGTAMGYFSIMKSDQAKDIYESKLEELYDPDTQKAVDGLSYYDSNWAWFGIALYQDALPNLTTKPN